jgi:lipopolysaccharide/colanic/teichoic acid biosynthesis glycosyltransferase
VREGGAAKRSVDLAASALGLALLSPLLAAVAVGIALTTGRPVLFRQIRVGRGGRRFTLVKFRTMREARDASGRSLPDEERLTRLGSFLRRTSLDELPELWNVLVGDMSLVGPRPLLVEYLPLYSPDQARRHEVRPGITGLAQVNGRNVLSWEDRFALDVWYVDHRSVALDLRILARTIGKVLTMEGIAPEGRGTMEPFRGTRS